MNRKIIKTRLRGLDLIREPLLNKGSAFTDTERRLFGLDGLLPRGHASIETQAQRNYESLSRFDDPLEQYVALASLQDCNETLFAYVLQAHLEEFLPIVYTPTVGIATQRFSHVFQRGRGVWITPDMQGQVAEVLRRGAARREVRLIVVTDNESILGIGDQGAGGMAISIGKLSLYTAGAGIDPATVLPVSLDVGTDNESLLADPMYLGWRQRRLRGAAYDALVEEFVHGVRTCFPGALVQWEDFRKDNALAILQRYRDVVPSFNDDIQGTGAVALAGILGAERVTERTLGEERIVIVGAGAAGLGIYRQIRAGMTEEGIDLPLQAQAIAVLDSRGLIVNDATVRDDYKREMAWEPDCADARDLRGGATLEAVCAKFQPTVLIGTSGQPGAFTRTAVRSVAAGVERPVILPLSNPDTLSEARPADLLAWTDGRALVATGSPFPPVDVAGGRREIGQGNNAFIFPGLGLGIMSAGAAQVSDRAISAAARALAGALTNAELNRGLLYPDVGRLPEVSAQVATSVLQACIAEGSASQAARDDPQAALKHSRWEPAYPDYEPG